MSDVVVCRKKSPLRRLCRIPMSVDTDSHESSDMSRLEILDQFPQEISENSKQIRMGPGLQFGRLLRCETTSNQHNHQTLDIILYSGSSALEIGIETGRSLSPQEDLALLEILENGLPKPEFKDTSAPLSIWGFCPSALEWYHVGLSGPTDMPLSPCGADLTSSTPSNPKNDVQDDKLLKNSTTLQPSPSTGDHHFHCRSTSTEPVTLELDNSCAADLIPWACCHCHIVLHVGVNNRLPACIPRELLQDLLDRAPMPGDQRGKEERLLGSLNFMKRLA